MDEPKKPHWWNNAHDLSWSKVKNAVVDEWNKASAGAQKLERNVAERAIALGHGARDAYAKLGPWTSDVEAKLKADWEQTNKDAHATWDKVRGAVKHGYEKAAAKKS